MVDVAQFGFLQRHGQGDGPGPGRQAAADGDGGDERGIVRLVRRQEYLLLPTSAVQPGDSGGGAGLKKFTAQRPAATSRTTTTPMGSSQIRRAMSLARRRLRHRRAPAP